MSNPDPKTPPVPTLAEIEAVEAEAQAEAEARAQEEYLFEALYNGTVDGDAFDGDPADLW